MQPNVFKPFKEKQTTNKHVSRLAIENLERPTGQKVKTYKGLFFKATFESGFVKRRGKTLNPSVGPIYEFHLNQYHCPFFFKYCPVLFYY